MVERVIVLPIRDNNGVSLARVVGAVRSEILAIAGGYSLVKQYGAWLDGDVTYRDTAWRLTTTVDPETDARIVERIPEWCERLRQVCIYTHASDVTADFVYPVSQETTSSGAA